MPIGQPFLHPYDLLLLAVGLALLATTLGRAVMERFNVTTSFVYLAAGLLVGPLLLDLAPEDPLEATPVLERVAELAVIMSLIVVGIRIGRPISWERWRSVTRLIGIVMPISILGVALTGHWLFGLALGPAILLGAILAPTDPILAGPLEEHDLEDEAEERFGLSGEAGLNDGLAFPFIYFGLYATLQPDGWRGWLGWWVTMDLLYAVAIALPLGWVLGRVVGRVYLDFSGRGAVTKKRTPFLPLALLLAVYGLTEAAGGYGFLAAFTTGLGFRRAMEEHAGELERFADFVESVDDLTRAMVLVMIGALLRVGDLLALGWPLLLFGLLLIVVLRPAVTYLATAGTGFRRLHRLYWGWFGIRGIGSIYYLAYALNQGVDAGIGRTLYTIVVGTVLLSVVLHGLSVRPFLERWEGEKEVEL